MKKLLDRASVRVLVALAVVVLLGALSRLHPIGWYPYDKSLGDACYAMTVYLVLALTRLPAFLTALLALSICFAVECFQATGVPAHYGHLMLVRWLVGTTFSWHDVGYYVVGVGVITALDVLMLRPVRAKH